MVSPHVLYHVMSLSQSESTAVLINVLFVERPSSGYSFTVALVRQLSSTEHVNCPDVVSTRRRSVKINEAVIR